MVTNQLQSSLMLMQSETIGLFRPKFGSNFLPVIEKEEGMLVCIEIGTLLGLSTLYIDSSQGKYVAFPEGKFLSDMMQDPMEFHEWYKQNCK